MQAGVLMHMWDNTEDFHQRWRGCPDHEPAFGSAADLAGNDCLLVGNRFSASIIWREHAPTFGGNSGGGIIFRPPFVRILCSYGADGGTRGAGGDGCKDQLQWCDDEEQQRDGWCSGQPFRPEALEVMLHGWVARGSPTYNEVIVDAAYHDQMLPHSIEAVLYDESVHKQVIETYHLSEDDVPLVFFDPADEWHPFKRTRNHLLG